VAKFILLNRLLQDGTIPNAVYAGNGRPDGEPRPRIVFTSSDSHRNSDPIDFDELGEWQEYGVNGGISRYSYYKLVLNTFATELSRRLNPDGGADVAVHAVCPGPVNTNIVRDAPPLLRAFLRFIFTFTFQSPAKAAPPLVYMGCAVEEEGKSNEYLHMRTRRPMDEKCYEPEAGRRLWEKTEELVRGMV
jgi:NAD(P)-dependent dehydrogenase (short-subunit alcohol dehydrogenase family)